MIILCMQCTVFYSFKDPPNGGHAENWLPLLSFFVKVVHLEVVRERGGGGGGVPEHVDTKYACTTAHVSYPPKSQFCPLGIRRNGDFRNACHGSLLPSFVTWMILHPHE